MSVIDPGMESMLEVFIYETTTLLEQLDEILLDSEKEKSMSEENVNEIFRIMHTIKGSSAMMGLTSISNLAHAVEDVFAIIRSDPAKMGPVSEAIFNLVFQASDFLKAEIDAVQNESYEPKDPADLIAQLEEQARVMNGQAAPAAAPGAAAASEAPAPAKDGFGRIRVFFEDGCQMENVRAFMLLSQVKDYCDELESAPAHPEADSSLCNEIIQNGFTLLFKPASVAQDLISVVEKAVNIKSYEVLEDPAEAAPEPEPQAEPSPIVQVSAPPARKPAPAPASKPAEPAANTGAGKNVKQSLISVNQFKLDQLMDLVGEIVTTESMVSGSPDLAGLKLDNFTKSTRELKKLTDDLQSIVMSMRMVPLTGTFQKMNRIVRDMSKKLGREVAFETVGGETEVDKTIVDSITDPLMHMIRNSMDHGIESPEERIAKGKPEAGTVTLTAENVGGEIVIKIGDDGGGLDKDKILKKAKERGLLAKPDSEYSDKEIFQMIMLPGFSTNDQVTEYSGRGVGMDVVHQNISKVGGTLSIDSAKDAGSTFTIKIPLTLAIVDGMELSVGGAAFTLPITSISQSFKVLDESAIIHDTNVDEMIMLRGECYPIIRLHQIFDMPTDITQLQDGILIQVESNQNSACIFVDQLLGEHQVVVKAFPSYLNRYSAKGRGISGCTILGDGSISLILDVNSLIKI